ncbi:MAG: EamA family transporter [Candidatus Nanoarchaeia archaeon]|jgi:transporter family protein
MNEWLKYVLLALLIQGTVVFFVKLLSLTINPLSILLAQYVGALISTVIYLSVKRVKPSVNKREALLAVLSGFLLATGLSFYYTAISLGSVSVVTPIQSVGVSLVPVLLAIIFLKERLTKRLVIGLVCSLAGIILLTI